MELTLDQVAKCLGLPPRGGLATGWSIDTRTLTPGDVFFALSGPEYTDAAYKAGAVHVIEGLPALQQLATCARKQWGGTIIGVTGSAGKTSTKDAIAHLLEAHMPVGQTIGNLNNHIGLPLSILRIPDNAKAAVLEMGMNHAGEIRALAEIAKPAIGVVTNVGHAHIEFFESIDGIALAKRELIEALPETGTAVLNADDERVIRFREIHHGSTVTYGFHPDAQISAEMLSPNRFRCLNTNFETQVSGRHAISNILAAIAVAQVFGIPPQHLTDAVYSLTPGTMRGERLTIDGITIFNDCYNSNPAAARAMIDVLAETPALRRIAVLGEMLELGRRTEPLHRQVGSHAAESGMDVLVAVRGAARFMADEAMRAGMSGDAAYFFEDPEQAGLALKGIAQPGDAVLFKGSRGVHMERALAAFTGKESAA